MRGSGMVMRGFAANTKPGPVHLTAATDRGVLL